MTDDLVKRLRGYGSNRYWPHGPACDCTQAADRIEELEAKLSESEALLERVLEALATILCNCVGDAERCGSKAALAELTGGNDE